MYIITFAQWCMYSTSWRQFLLTELDDHFDFRAERSAAGYTRTAAPNLFQGFLDGTVARNGRPGAGCFFRTALADC